MFEHFKNIESAFRHVRLFTIVLIGASAVICCFTILKSYQMVSEAHNRIYLLVNGKAFEAVSSGRQANLPVEARDHIRTFHELFFTLDPDEKVIDANIARSLYLADGTAKRQYDGLKESGYYSEIIAGNVSQKVSQDSIYVDTQHEPYHFRYYGVQIMIRPTATVRRSLITEGYLRNVGKSDNNPHGFLIERWRIIENKDIDEQRR